MSLVDDSRLVKWRLPLRHSDVYVRLRVALCGLVAVCTGCASASGGEGKRENAFPPAVTIGAVPADFIGQDLTQPLLDTVLGQAEETQRRVQEAVKRCMTALGYQYVVFELKPLGRTPANVNDASWRTQHGYGVSEALSARTSRPQISDPNQPYLDSLSESERAGYGRALHGDSEAAVPITNAQGEEIATYVPGGCMMSGIRETLGYDSGQMTVYLDEIETVRNASIVRMRADDRYKRIWSTWSVCMAEAGWSVKDRDAALELAAREPSQERQLVDADNACSRTHDTDREFHALLYAYEQWILKAIEPVAAEVASRRQA